jgi:hypothetical protein
MSKAAGDEVVATAPSRTSSPDPRSASTTSLHEHKGIDGPRRLYAVT